MNPSRLSEDELKQTMEAKQSTLNILNDALKKKDHLLVEKPEDFTGHSSDESIPLISPSLVQDLISELQKVTFMKSSDNVPKDWVAYVHYPSNERVIYLCPPFWNRSAFLGSDSCPTTIIHEVAHFLGYAHTVEETMENVKKNHLNQQKILPLTNNSMESAFARYMNHKGTYTIGSYSCCGERSRDSVCDNSEMSFYLRDTVGIELEIHNAGVKRINSDKDLFFYYDTDNTLDLHEGEQILAEEAKQRTLNILTDTLKKRDRLLVENPEDFTGHSSDKSIPLISPSLVQDLISELQKVTFVRGYRDVRENWITYVYPRSDERIIFLCPPFWFRSKFLGTESRPAAIIHEVSHFLGYEHTITETMENRAEKHFNQRKLLPLTNYCIESAFARYMNHKGIYTKGFYSCCGERSRDSVCDNSEMSVYLRKKPSPLSEDEQKVAEEAKQRTLNILTDTLKKKDLLLVSNPEDFTGHSSDKYIPLISPSLVEDLISELQKVTFMRGRDHKGTIAYVHPRLGDRTIYLCPPFWERSESLKTDSCPVTIIHEVSHFLGYMHTVTETMGSRMEKQFNHRKLLPRTNYCIESAFAEYMNHDCTYLNGSYSCCGEKSRDSVCENSKMSHYLSYYLLSRDIIWMDCSKNVTWSTIMTALLSRTHTACMEEIPAEKVPGKRYYDPNIGYSLLREKKRISYITKLSLSPRLWSIAWGAYLSHHGRLAVTTYINMFVRGSVQYKGCTARGACVILTRWKKGTIVQGKRLKLANIRKGQFPCSYNASLTRRGTERSNTTTQNAYHPSLKFDFTNKNSSPLSEDEQILAEKAKQRTLNILIDTLKKKDRLLVENPEDFTGHSSDESIPLISPSLVQDLISELQKVTFMRGKDDVHKDFITYVYPRSAEGIIFLCPPFWQRSTFLGTESRPAAIIHEVSHFLGYEHTITETMENQMETHFNQRKLLPLTNYCIESAFALYMNHKGIYTKGFYSCCGERSRDSVCDNSEMSIYLRKKPTALTEDEQKVAEEVKQRTLNILKDTLKKKDRLLVEETENLNYRSPDGLIPLITQSLVEDLIRELQNVTFVRSYGNVHEDLISCNYSPSDERIIYLSHQFCKKGAYLGIDSRPAQIIHEVSHFLGFEHSIEETMASGKESHFCQRKSLPLTIFNIDSVFALFMNHEGTYKNGFYSCCGEKSRDSVCDNSVMGIYLRKEPSPLSEGEQKLAEEAKQRTLNVLFDVLKKKDHLLVEKPEDFSDYSSNTFIALITPSLVKDLISELQKVTFMRGRDDAHKNWIAYVYYPSDERIIYLCPHFWTMSAFFGIDSHPETIIHEVCHILGYGHTLGETMANRMENNFQQRQLLPLTTYCIESAFARYMNHRVKYMNGSYSCCDEKAMDSVCINSKMSSHLSIVHLPKSYPINGPLSLRRKRKAKGTVLSVLNNRIKLSSLSEDEMKLAEEAKQRTLDILTDALKKKDCVLVEKPEDFTGHSSDELVPLISPSLVEDLISELQKVKFRGSSGNVHKDWNAYICKRSNEKIIYLCPPFWKKSTFLEIDSHPSTIIHEVSHFLGYMHTVHETMYSRMENQSNQQKLLPLTNFCITSAFARYMNHNETYKNGTYSCCGEKSRDSVCEQSTMSSHLR
ncbi:Peptidyl-Lys metalloendopeptidase [Pelobates cultripes]|uniref:Peptidyl-Lys metalloendopeptidase n=1 Tax=Pelobates cultripes TaxID=61616 RepID=A0AAD1WGM8_PELCU|nr:Peptidyl-Lys metalloendopeptidase [Pelobates cultripes]